MDSPSDLFQQQQPSEVFPFDLYRNPPETPATGPLYPGVGPASYPIVSPLLHPNSASQRWGGYRQRQCLFSGPAAPKDDQEEEGGDVDVSGRRGRNDGGSQALQSQPQDRRRRSSDPECGEWSQDLLRVKRIRVDSVVRREGDMEREGRRRRRRRSGSQTVREEKSEEDEGRRLENREGRRRQRHELKLQLEETRGRLLELQRKVWRAYGEQQIEEDRGGEGEDEDAGLDDVAEMFSEGEGDDRLAGALSPPMLCSSVQKRESSRKVDSEVFPQASVDLDVELDGGGVWLGCSLVRGEWENPGGGEKFAQALKQELASVVARVIDRVVRLYAESDHSSPSAEVGAQETPTKRSLCPIPDKRPKLGGAEHALDPAEALPLVMKRPQEKRNQALNQGRLRNPLIPQPNPGLPLLPQPPLSALLPQRNKDPFLPSCPPNPPHPLPLPLLHYTMQHLFARSLSSIPLHKDGLSNEPFMEFRSHNPSFAPLPLLGQFNPPLTDRARDEGMRSGVAGVVDGGDAALYLGAGSEGLSPCHLKKAKLMFFYARYPSSSTLKTYFPDVKFNRCVTSQLIKWFSNFREFFYIQMERFARQAAREGLAAREGVLRLGRNSELFRILNMHYNKSNDYQVPDRFVEVSEVALREFFTAIQSGRDADPCWKKSIYKIICKLDSPVPDSFRLPGCPMDTHRMV